MPSAPSDQDNLLRQSPMDLAGRLGDNKRILALKLDHIGDLVVSFPAFRLLRAKFPDHEITLVCGSWNVALAEASGFFDKIVVYDFFAQKFVVNSRLPHEPVEQLLTRISPPYGVAIDMRVDPETRPILARIDARLKCGVDAFRRFPFLDIALPTASEGDWKYSYATPLRPGSLLWAALKAIVPLPTKVFLKPAAQRAVRRLKGRNTIFRPRAAQARLHNAEHLILLVTLIDLRLNLEKEVFALPPAEKPVSVPARRMICIAPIGNSSIRWPLEHYAALIELMIARTDCDVVLLGTAEQSDALRQIIPHGPAAERVRLEAGKTSLLDAARLIERAALYVGNDSGLAHLAAALGVPVVSIFAGYVEVEEWGPRGPQSATLAANIACRGCGFRQPQQCPNGLACVHAIAPKDVFGAVTQKLGR